MGSLKQLNQKARENQWKSVEKHGLSEEVRDFGAVLVGVVELVHVDPFFSFRDDVRRDSGILAVAERHHPSGLFFQQEIGREMSITRRYHQVERVGRTAPHEVGQLLI